jgi:hypothetical protein
MRTFISAPSKAQRITALAVCGGPRALNVEPIRVNVTWRRRFSTQEVAKWSHDQLGTYKTYKTEKLPDEWCTGKNNGFIAGNFAIDEGFRRMKCT